jgi:ABC-2 type transport system permease protein
MSFLLPVYALWRRDLQRFWVQKSRVFGFVGSPLVFWIMLGSGFGDLRYYFPGMLALTVMFSAVFSMMSLIEDRREGFLLSALVSPAPRSAVVLGKILGSSTLAWLQSLAFLALGLFLWPDADAARFAAVAAALFPIAFAFTGFGFFFAWKIDSTQGFHSVVNLVLFPMWMVSGALFPIETAHGWMQYVMRANPMTYALGALRRLIDPTAAALTDPLVSIILVVVCGMVLLAASIALAREPRSGTL